MKLSFESKEEFIDIVYTYVAEISYIREGALVVSREDIEEFAEELVESGKFDEVES